MFPSTKNFAHGIGPVPSYIMGTPGGLLSTGEAAYQAVISMNTWNK